MWHALDIWSEDATVASQNRGTQSRIGIYDGFQWAITYLGDENMEGNVTYESMWGFFFYSEKQAAIRAKHNRPTNFCETEDGKILQYTEWVSTGVKPFGQWNDYIPLGRAKYHHSE
jgi:hypothetical protein